MPAVDHGRPRRIPVAVTAAALVLLAACDTTPVTAPLPAGQPAPVDVRAYLSLPGTAVVAGTRITLALNAQHPLGTESFGSFAVRIAYDTSRLHFVAAEQSHEGMVLARAANGVVTVAGASSSGFTQETIAGLTIDVVDPAALETLALEVLELTTTTFHEQHERTVVDQRVYRRAVQH